jgi:hypothetical protein
MMACLQCSNTSLQLTYPLLQYSLLLQREHGSGWITESAFKGLTSRGELQRGWVSDG